MTIIVDTNVVIASLIQEGIVRKLILGYPGSFVTPQSCIDEVWEHRGDWNKKELPDEELNLTIYMLTEDFVLVLPKSAFQHHLAEAKTLIDDPDDVPFVALALSIDNDGIRTFNTKDFSKLSLTSRIRILGTSDVKRLLSAS